MKSGTGDDPFADDASDADESANGETTAEAVDSGPDSATEADSTTDSASAAADVNTDESAAPSAEAGDADDSGADAGDADEADDAPAIPWVLRRSSVKADRPNVTQFFLRDETDRAERRFQSDVEELLDADVYTLDLREAAYLVAMRHPDEVADELRDWGYEYME